MKGSRSGCAPHDRSVVPPFACRRKGGAKRFFDYGPRTAAQRPDGGGATRLSAVSCSLSPDLLNTGLTPRPQERKGAAAPPSRKFVLGLATGVAVLGPWLGMENASGRLRRPSVVLMPDRTDHWTLTPLTLTLSPQAGRGNKCSRRAPCPPLAPWNGEPRPQAEIPAGSKGWGEGKWSRQL